MTTPHIRTPAASERALCGLLFGPRVRPSGTQVCAACVHAAEHPGQPLPLDLLPADEPLTGQRAQDIARALRPRNRGR
ncbi:hypothetical protein ACIOUE_07090 [Streptomyces xanthochromogenes]|uniref:hypothetical protein n=1 Tax=Streptomyces xanthochromogenes TaxID=67384 RepID=UPI00382F4254